MLEECKTAKNVLESKTEVRVKVGSILKVEITLKKQKTKDESYNEQKQNRHLDLELDYRQNTRQRDICVQCHVKRSIHTVKTRQNGQTIIIL